MRLIFLILIFVNSVFSQEAFLLGNKLFSEKKYEEAIESYKKIDYKGFGAWFNLGDAYFKLGNYLDAFLNAIKASR